MPEDCKKAQNYIQQLGREPPKDNFYLSLIVDTSYKGGNGTWLKNIQYPQKFTCDHIVKLGSKMVYMCKGVCMKAAAGQWNTEW